MHPHSPAPEPDSFTLPRVDVATAVESADEYQLWNWHCVDNDRAMLEYAGAKSSDPIIHKALSNEAMITPLEGLQVVQRLVDLLLGRRWSQIRRAREDGATWQQIGEALGMTRQGAYDWYKTKIEHQDQYDALDEPEAARAALGRLEDAPLAGPPSAE